MLNLEKWLLKKLSGFSLVSLPADASFRQYYRVTLSRESNTYIAVFSPPAAENNAAFLKMSRVFTESGLIVPQVIAYDLKQGFLLLTDLGDEVLFKLLNRQSDNHSDKNIDKLYQKILSELGKIQQCSVALPDFDAIFMGEELVCFEEWYLKKHLKLKLSANAQKMLAKTFEVLLDSAGAQPQCCIHRDYHCRNLMILPNENIGILDFQDAMQGPATYDLASLIRDCYAEFPRRQVEQWALSFHHEFLKKLIPSQEQFMRYVDLMGIQRHLKAIFIFARKFHRDGDERYLENIPRVLNYIRTVSAHYPELKSFKAFMEEIPA